MPKGPFDTVFIQTSPWRGTPPEHYEWQTPDEDSAVPKPELGAERKRMEREAETWPVPYRSVG